MKLYKLLGAYSIQKCCIGGSDEVVITSSRSRC